jgi:hypothetical protein
VREKETVVVKEIKAKAPRKAKTSKTGKPKAPVKLKNLSPKGLRAVKAFKGVKGPRMPAKLKGPNAAVIRRAVRDHFLG